LSEGGRYNRGTVFEMVAPVGEGSYKERVLWNFNGADGANSYASVIRDSSGKLYGTTQNGGASDSGVVFEVNPAAAKTTIMLTSSPNPSTYGQAVTFTAVVSSGAGTPPDGETVTFVHRKAAVGTGTLSGGSASFTTSTLKVGTTEVTAEYDGDLNFLGSKSNTVKQKVDKGTD
jgi:uncharacterized repeat protein (TIGR03803 family)